MGLYWPCGTGADRRQATHGEKVQTSARAAMSISTLATNYKRAMPKIPKHEEIKVEEASRR